MMSEAIASALLLAAAGAFDPAPAVDYTRDIAPILAARCYQCHGPDADARKAGLRLDRRDGALHAGSGGRPAIVPGDPDGSELIARVTSIDPDDRMPTADGHAALAAVEVAALRAWIAAGAPYARHWSWEPLPDGAPSTRLLDAWTGTGDVAHAAAVDHRSWLRRVHFDIAGLPPSPEEVRAFDADHSQAARARVVDALLDSPRYGERWGRHWMDAMRYAETLGHEYDYPVEEAWRWRDWVIRALNADLPYAQFVREQVAGDLLASPRANPADGTDESVTATGWWWMTQGTHAPVDVRLDQAERIDNQIDVATKAFLGTTASCARCHDHKFDDVSQRDYYALFGVVRSSRRTYAYDDPTGVIRRAFDELAAATSMPGATPAVTDAPPASPPGATWTFDDGGLDGWTASGWAFNGPRAADGILSSARLAPALHGTVRSPAFTVPEEPIRVRCRGTKARVRLVIDGFFLDERNAVLFEGFIQGVDHPGEWRTLEFDARRYAGETAYLEVADDGDGFIALDWVALGPVPESARAPSPVPPLVAPDSSAPPIPAPVRILAMEDGTGMDSPLYVRGSTRAPGDLVPRGMIAGLRTATDAPEASPLRAGSGRLALAEEIVSPTNPLSWRVMANRVWHHMTGRGIVPSTDDFGVLGRAPEDLELLDYLAQRLRAHGSIKQLVREIALSGAYRRADRPLRRLDGEALRDAMIVVAGDMDRSMGGPGVPVHLTDAMQGRGRPGRSGPLDGARRRSVYLEVRRNFLSPFMTAFDQPVPTTTAGTRSVSNVPVQGLTLMNDPFVRAEAERWGRALSAATQGGPPDASVRAAFRAAFARDATDRELADARSLLGDAPDADAWADLAHAIFLSTEFRYLR